MKEKQRKQRVCLYDNELYTPTSNSSKYCCTEHRDAHYKELGKFANSQRKYKNKQHEHPFAGARQCVICGLWYRAVCHHAWNAHGIFEHEYKKMAGLDHKKGLIPDDLKEVKAKHVFENGTVENLKKGKKNWYKKGDKSVGKYERSPQTKRRLHIQGKIIAAKYAPNKGQARKHD